MDSSDLSNFSITIKVDSFLLKKLFECLPRSSDGDAQDVALGLVVLLVPLNPVLKDVEAGTAARTLHVTQ